MPKKNQTTTHQAVACERELHSAEIIIPIATLVVATAKVATATPSAKDDDAHRGE